MNYQEIIEKAIKYIKENLYWVKGSDELLNILEGGSNDIK